MTDDEGEQRDGVLRADAERNRDRILAAARELYAREGLDISMAAVARRAGVGKATLSRRFASKQQLIAAVFVDRMGAYLDATRDALEEPDRWAGFIGFVETICGMQAADRGFADVLTTTLPAAPELEALRASSFEGFTQLIAGAKAAGFLREDFASQDLVIMLMANAGVVAAAGDAAQLAHRRLVGRFLQAIATPDAPLPPLPPLPPDEQLAAAMTRSI